MENLDWSSRFEQIGSCFRLGMEAQGSDYLIACIDDLAPLLPKCSIFQFDMLNTVLGQVFSAQKRKDYLLVADLLEYEIAPLVCGLTNVGVTQMEKPV